MRDPLRAIARHLAQVGASTSVGARWEDNPRNIAKHYLKTWFTLDLISYAAMRAVCYLPCFESQQP